jgi:TrmH family RNA methyltransferase
VTRAGGGRTVDSAQNTAVKRARALERDRALRERERVYVAWGLHLAQEALRTRAPLRQAFIGPRLQESREGRDLQRGLGVAGVPTLMTTTRILDTIADGSGDQGVLLICARPEHPPSRLLRSQVSLTLAAHGVQDPGNLGSILRSAMALGASGLVVLPGCADPFGSRAVRAAMGTQFALPVAAADIGEFLELARDARLQIVAADPYGADAPNEADLTIPTVLLVGSEGRGLPEELLDAARRRVRIPMAHGVESLNVHAAAVALLYEAARQRGFRFGGDPADRPGP